MPEPKRTAFDNATGGTDEEVAVETDATESGIPVPRAVFTKDSKIDPSKIQVGQLRVAQGATQEVKDRKASVGQFVLSNFPAHDSVILIPLGDAEIRVYKPDPKAPALCIAPTGDFGFGKPGGVCADCEKAKWGDKNEITGKSRPPACKDGITIRFYSVTHNTMVDYQFLAGDRARGSFLQQQAMSLGNCAFAIRLTTTDKENDRGSWSVPQIEMLPDESAYPVDKPRLVTEAQWDTARKWFHLFSLGQVDTREQALLQLQAGI